MHRYLSVLLFFGLAWGQIKIKDPFWEGLILKKEQKIEYVEIGEKVVIYYEDSAESTASGKIKGITKEIIKLRRDENGQTLEVNYGDISRLDRNVRPNKASCSCALIGSIIAGGYIASIGDWSTGSDAFAGMIITPIAAMFGGGMGGVIGFLKDSSNKNTKQYLIKDGEWELSIKQKKSLPQFALPFLFK